MLSDSQSMPQVKARMASTGGGSGYQSGNIGNAADGSAGVYRTYHSAQAFTYTLGPENGLLPNTDYVAVLHFAGRPYTPCAQLPHAVCMGSCKHFLTS